jgi:microcystin-dependent protein
MTPYIGEIRIFAGNFPPVGHMFCEGQLLPISEYDTLFTLIGTTYGGDGQETFALPDLRGRVPIHMDGTNFVIGQRSGTESETLTIQQIPTHSHATTGKITIPVRGDSVGHLSSPVNNAIAVSPNKKFFSKTGSASGTMAPLDLGSSTVMTSGGSQPHDNMQPFLAVNYIISLFGVFPSPT